MIHNHAHQKLFPFLIAHPHSLLLLPTFLPFNQYVIKLPLSEPFLEPRNQHIIKLQAHSDYT
jgi:hypothetical protein